MGVGGDLIEHYQEGLGNRWRATHMRQSRGPARVVNPTFLWGANVVFRREALFEAGLYDERCRTNGEDVPVSRALTTLRKKLVYTPSARCRHLRQDTMSSILDTYWRWRFYGNWEEISLYWTFKQNKGNFKYMPPLVQRNISEGNWSNLVVDTALPFYRAYELLKRERDAIFYVQKAGYHSLAPFLAAWENRNPIVLDYDDYDVNFYPFGALAEILPDFEGGRFLENLATRASLCVAASRELLGLVSRFNENTLYLPTGVDLWRFDGGPVRKPEDATDPVRLPWRRYVSGGDSGCCALCQTATIQTVWPRTR